MDTAKAPPELRGLVAGDGGRAGAIDKYGAADPATELPKDRRPSSLPPLASGNSKNLTAGIIIADVVGAGILSMGVAVAKFGWLLGTVAIFVLLAMNIHTSLLLWRVRMGCPSTYTYLDLASAAFARAPEWQRRWAERSTLTAQQLFIFLTLGIYSLSIGRALGTLLYAELRLCLPWLVCLGLLVVLPVLLSSRTMGQNRFLIALNVLTIMGSVIIPLHHMVAAGTAETRLPGSTVQAVADISVVGVLSGVEVMCFAFSSQFMLVEIIAEMSEPAEFPEAYMISAPFQFCMYLVAGIGAYVYMGSRVSGILGENLPFGPTFRVASVCLLVHMLISFLIKGVVFCRWAQQTWNVSGINDTSLRGWLGWAATVVVSTSLCWLVAQIVPFFTQLMDLLGATMAPLACYIFPILMYLRWLHDTGDLARVGPWEGCAFILEALLSLACLTFGTYFAIATIAKSWDTFGMPFDCHCRNIWATCACSAQHPGMEHCLANMPP